MIAFTILGLLVFWIFCWQIGYVVAFLCDANARIDNLCAPAVSEMEVLISMINALPLPSKERENA